MFKKYGDESVAIFHGDCINVMQSFASDSVDLIFADPPYNIGKNIGGFRDDWPSENEYLEWCYKWLCECIRILKPAGSMYVMASTQSMPHIDLWLREKMHVLSRIVWHYDSSGVQAKKYFGSLYEPILHCVRDSKNYTFNTNDIQVQARTGAVRKLIDYRKPVPAPYRTTKLPGNTWYIPRVRYRMPEYEDHPTQKPEGLLERIIRASSNTDDTILDPFAGTFTTCAVAKRLNRFSIGVELQTEYVKIGIRRLGLATEFNGEELKKPDKSYRRRSEKQPNQRSNNKNKRDLFDGPI